VDGRVVARVPVKTARKVPAVGLLARVFGSVGTALIVIGLVLAAVTGSLLFAMARWRRRQSERRGRTQRATAA
jgi:hypothetical protein